MKKKDDALNDLQKKLEEVLIFPTNYMFKFIFQADNRKIAMIESFFDERSVIRLSQSSRKHYVCLTVVMPVEDIHQIMNIYRKVDRMGGVMYF
jgi:putative lipoic acid-binding regulatory protein